NEPKIVTKMATVVKKMKIFLRAISNERNKMLDSCRYLTNFKIRKIRITRSALITPMKEADGKNNTK
ncbi:hypothetical protein OFN55_31705, partial [Escherichia coli]|nr:hypothetical protein [Escherichia coli]